MTLAQKIEAKLKDDYYAVRTYKSKVDMLVKRAGSLRKAAACLGTGHSTLQRRRTLPHIVTHEQHLAIDYVLHVTQREMPE